VAGSPVPFVDIALKLNFTTRDNKTTSQILSMLTNVTGTAKLRNLFTNETYQVEARRYNLLFTTQTLTIEPSPTSALISLELTLPTYTMNVHVLDSKTAPVSRVEIRVYEWASGVTSPLMSLQTNASGDGSFSLPFGIYRLKAYEGDVFLGETLLSLVQNQSNFTFSLSALNVDVTVTVLDYFGRPIANAMVEIERKIAQEYLGIDKKSTGADGSATFPSILGGDSRISVYVAGKLVAAKTQLLDGTSSQVTFNIGEYITIVGYPVETSLFVLFSFMLVLVILLVIINRKRIIQVARRKPAS
jgi:5-hydroxyisourate hydrolase-like protein (transthyretin family)